MKTNVEHLSQIIYIKKPYMLSYFIILLEGFLLIYISGVNGFMKFL